MQIVMLNLSPYITPPPPKKNFNNFVCESFGRRLTLEVNSGVEVELEKGTLDQTTSLL